MDESNELDRAPLPGLAIFSGGHEARALVWALEPPATREKGGKNGKKRGGYVVL
jgi:hypothetical protein